MKTACTLAEAGDDAAVFSVVEAVRRVEPVELNFFSAVVLFILMMAGDREVVVACVMGGGLTG